MSFLFILNSLKIGGTEKKSINIANSLSNKGYEVHICYMKNPDILLESISEGIKVWPLARRRKIDPDSYIKLKKIIIENDIKNIFCMNLYPGFYGVLCKKTMKTLNLNCFVFVNTTDIMTFKERAQMFFYWPFLRAASGIVFGCKSQQDQWTSHYFLPRKRASVIYNGVDCSYFSSETVAVDTSQEIVIVNVAEFRPEKQQEDLIRAGATLLERGWPIRLILVGEGPEKSRLERLAKDLGLNSKVQFPGQVGDVRPFLGIADIFALTSVAVETFSNAALEAMAMGKPVVLSNIGGASEMITDSENGFLYPAGNINALLEKLMLLVESPEIRQAMGVRAREVVRERFDFDVMVNNYEKLASNLKP